MKALSLMQPMAWAIFHGKDIENRTWKTKVRGRIMIHASQKFDSGHYDWIARNENRLGCILPSYQFQFIFGAILGEVDIVDCVRGHGSLWAFPDQYNFVLANPKLYEKPIPCKGKLGFFDPDIESVQV